MSIHLFTFSDIICRNSILRIVYFAQRREEMKRYNIYYRQDGRFEGRILKEKKRREEKIPVLFR